MTGSQPRPDIRRAGRAANALIEAAGRHPFATGLFAILGVVGFFFSLYTYTVDRREARAGDAQGAAIAEQLADVSARVAAQDADAADARRADPLIVSFEEASDNVVFVAGTGLTDRPLRADEAYGLMTRVAAGEPHFSSTPYFDFSVRSDADKLHVQIAPYLVLDVRKVTRIDPVRLASLYDAGRGGAAVVRTFAGDLVPLEGMHIAPLVEEETNAYPRIDYLTLAPGETEEFFLTLSYVPGYVYEFRIGLQTRFGSRAGVTWLPGTFSRGIPLGEMRVYDFSGERFETKAFPDAVVDGRPLADAPVWNAHARHLDRYVRSRLFRLSQAGLDEPVRGEAR